MRSPVVTISIVLCWTMVVYADFDECLGIEMDTVLTVPSCMRLYSACQVRVNKLNQKLHLAPLDVYQPVTIISANESKTATQESMTMLVQVASVTDCLSASTTGSEDRCDGNSKKVVVKLCTKCFGICVYGNSCQFDMSSVDFYSIRLTHGIDAGWTLDGDKRYALSDNERAQIVRGYNSGQFYGSKLSIGIFDAPSLPFESELKESVLQTIIALVAASVSVLLLLALVVHQRRSFQKGYAPIQVQGKIPDFDKARQILSTHS